MTGPGAFVVVAPGLFLKRLEIMSKTKYEVWRGGRWIELTESLYEFAVNNNHYGRINGVLQHGDPEKKSSGIAAVGVAEYGDLKNT